jgi:hypothetical protein
MYIDIINRKVIHRGRCECKENSRGHKKGDSRDYFVTDWGDFMVSIRDTKGSGADGYDADEFNKFYTDITPDAPKETNLKKLLEDLLCEYKSIVNSAYCQCPADDDLITQCESVLNDKPKRLSDITREQGIILAKLAYSNDIKTPCGTKNWIQSDFNDIDDFKFSYHPYDHRDYGDAQEVIRISFKAFTFGLTIDDIRMSIHPNLNINMSFNYKGGSTLGSSNQYFIHEKFNEWNIVPSPELIPKRK